MTDPAPANGNGCRKATNRRYKSVGACVALVTIAFYVCLIRKVDPEWFRIYADFMTWAVIIAVAGLSATDGIRSWRNGNGSVK